MDPKGIFNERPQGVWALTKLSFGRLFEKPSLERRLQIQLGRFYGLSVLILAATRFSEKVNSLFKRICSLKQLESLLLIFC